MELLIVEPDPQVGRMMAASFESQGHRTTLLPTLAPALELNQFALAIVDSTSIGGQEWRLLAAFCENRLIFTSTWDACAITRRYGCPCFHKPFSPSDIYRSVGWLLAS